MKPTMPPVNPALLLEHAEFVRALARSLIRDPAGADDVEQETWLRALQREPREPSNPRGWLATIAHNVVRNRARAQTRRTARESASARAEHAPPSSLGAEQADTLRSVVNAVAALDEPYRDTVLALYFQGLTARALAKRDGVPEATIRSRHQRALAKLRERLDGEHGERATWCAALAASTGLEAGAAAGLASPAVVAGAVLVVTLAGAAAWWWTRTAAPEVSHAVLGAAASAPTGEARQETLGEGDADGGDESVRNALSSAGIELTGAVLDARLAGDERPPEAAAGAVVALQLVRRPRGFGNPEVFAKADVVAGEDGRFEWRVEDPGERPLTLAAQVKASAEHRALFVQADLVTPADRRAELVLRRPRHGDVEMFVEREEGAPLEGALVQLLMPDNATRLERVSDDAGRVVFENVSSLGLFSVVAEGWTVIRYDQPALREEGGWTPGKLVMAPHGALRVRVIDGAGAPLVGASVLLSRTAWELEGAAAKPWGAPHALFSRSGTTDELGEARFDSVWANEDLEVRVDVGRQSLRAQQRALDGRLVSLVEDGLAIRVRPGLETVVEARWSKPVRLELTLNRADGAALDMLEVWVLDAGRTRGDSNHVLANQRLPAPAGPVTLSIGAPEFAGPLVVFASDGPGSASRAPIAGSSSLSGQAQRPPASLAVGRAELELERLESGGAARLSLELEPVANITGTLIGRDGAPAKHLQGGMGGVRIDVVPTGGSRAAAGRFLRLEARVLYVGESDFEVIGLLPGDYDLLVSEQIERFYTFSGAAQRNGPISAPSRDVKIRIGDPGVVRVSIRTDAAPELAPKMVVLMGALTPADESRLPARRAPPRRLVEGRAPWPALAPLDFTGIGGGRDELGLWSFGCDPSDSSSEVELPPLPPGWYAFGVHPGGPRGKPYAPAAAELAYYDAGDYELDFRLTPTAEVRGVAFRGSEALLALELVAPDGERVQYLAPQQFGAASTVRTFVPSSGVVTLNRVPLGAYRLRAGSPWQLDRGHFQAELELVVGPDGASFELDLR